MDVCTISLIKLGKKTLSAHRGVIYQTKGKGPLYTSVQSDGVLSRVQHDLTIRAIIPKHSVTVKSRVSIYWVAAIIRLEFRHQ